MPPLLEIDGRIHISADQVARQARVSRDSVGRLARRGVLAGQVLAGGWYLERESVMAFIAQRAKNGSTQP